MKRAQSAIVRHASVLYLGAIAVLTGLLVAAALAYADSVGAHTAALLAVALLVLLPASDFAIACVQRVVVSLVPPKRLPRLDFSKGVPETVRTMVIVPTMLTTANGVDLLLEHLEVLALGNSDPFIHFAILSDFADTSTSNAPSDDAILARARAGIEALNVKIGEGHADRFFLFHRDRQWNLGERAWIGWERKRGKIEEFNRLLRGASDTSFSTQVGELAVLPTVRTAHLDSTRAAARCGEAPDRHHRPPTNQALVDRRLGLVTRATGFSAPRQRDHGGAASRCSREHRRAPASTMRRRSPTSIRTCSAKASSRERASTRRCVRGGTRGSRARKRATLARSLRGPVRAALVTDIEVVDD